MKKKTLSRPVLSFLFFVILGVAFFIMWGKQMPFDAKTKKAADEKAVQKTGTIYSLEPLVVELAGRYLNVTKVEEGKRPQIGTRKKYLIIAVDLELKNEIAVKNLEKQLDQVRDAIREIASSKKVKDIENIEGKTALSNEIADKLNIILQEHTVTNAFFAEFIIQ
jgi:flagellar basal body-associated protein FliL